MEIQGNSRIFALPYESHVIELTSLWKENILCDVKIVVDDGHFMAHKIILAASAPYFKTLYAGLFEDKNANEITLNGFTTKGLGTILNGLYARKLELACDNVFAVLSLAHYLQISYIVSCCGTFLETHVMKPYNCIKIWKRAKLYEMSETVRVSEQYILRNFYTVSQTESFKELSQQELIHFLSSDDMECMKEMEAFEAALQWIRYSPDRHGIAALILQHVRFGRDSVSQQELIDAWRNPIMSTNIECQKLLQQAMQYKILPKTQQSETKHKWKETRGEKCMVVFGKIGLHINEMEPPSSITGMSIVNDRMPVVDIGQLLPENSPLNTYRGYGYVLQLGNCVYITGGMYSTFGSTRSSNVMTIYNFDTETTERLASMGIARRAHVAFYTKNNQIVVAGGLGDSGAVDSVEVYDISRNMWTPGNSLPRAVFNAASCTLNGTGFVTGGTKADLGDGTSNESYQYNPENGQWQQKASMNVARFKHFMCTSGGSIYVFGGNPPDYNTQNSGGTMPGIRQEAIEQYNPSVNQWTIITDIPPLPHRLSVVQNTNDEMYIMGKDPEEMGVDHGSGMWAFNTKSHSCGKIRSLYITVNNAQVIIAKMPLQKFQEIRSRGCQWPINF